MPPTYGTTKYWSLMKPEVGTCSWPQILNTNLDTIDMLLWACAGMATFYVSLNGAGTKSGESAANAMPLTPGLTDPDTQITDPTIIHSMVKLAEIRIMLVPDHYIIPGIWIDGGTFFLQSAVPGTKAIVEVEGYSTDARDGGTPLSLGSARCLLGDLDLRGSHSCIHANNSAIYMNDCDLHNKFKVDGIEFAGAPLIGTVNSNFAMWGQNDIYLEYPTNLNSLNKNDKWCGGAVELRSNSSLVASNWDGDGPPSEINITRNMYPECSNGYCPDFTAEFGSSINLFRNKTSIQESAQTFLIFLNSSVNVGGPLNYSGTPVKQIAYVIERSAFLWSASYTGLQAEQNSISIGSADVKNASAGGIFEGDQGNIGVWDVEFDPTNSSGSMFWMDSGGYVYVENCTYNGATNAHANFMFSTSDSTVELVGGSTTLKAGSVLMNIERLSNGMMSLNPTVTLNGGTEFQVSSGGRFLDASDVVHQ